MNIKRLESARDFLFWLDEAPSDYLDEHFDMTWWGGPHNLKGETPYDWQIKELAQTAQCQTSACAIGWLGSVEDNGGLYLIRDTCDFCDAKPDDPCAPYCVGRENPWVRSLVPRYEHHVLQGNLFSEASEDPDDNFRNRSGWTDIAQYFDIPEHIVDEIFSSDSERYEYLRDYSDVCSDSECYCRRDSYQIKIRPGDVARVIQDVINEHNEYNKNNTTV